MKLFKAVNSYCKIQPEINVESERKGILIVDDSKFSRNILKDILKAEGYLIVGEAGDGLEAIEMAKAKKPEYIFMDVEMPKLDGIGAVPRILEFDPDINIIMCTALGQKKIILEAAKAGAKDYVLKPYLKENILGVLNVIADTKVIPFKSGKKHQEDLTNNSMEEKLIKPLAVVEALNSDTEFKIEDDFITDKNPDLDFEMDEFLQPLEFEEDNAEDEGLDSLFDRETLQGIIDDEVLESYVYEEVLEKVEYEEEAEPENAKLDNEASEDNEAEEEAELEEAKLDNEALEVDEFEEEVELEEAKLDNEALDGNEFGEEAELEEAKLDSEASDGNEFEEEAELEDAILDIETSEADEVEEVAELQEAKVIEEASEADEFEVEAELEEAKVIDEAPEAVKTEEKAVPDNTSYSNPFTYLWNNRFDISQKEFKVQYTVSHRVSFYEYAYLKNDKYDLYGNDYSEREMMLGIMKAYMSVDNRLQQKETTTVGLKASTYAKEVRLFTSSILVESNKYTEITIAEAIKCNSLKPMQTPREIMNETGFHQALCDLVHGKSGRVLR